MFHSLLRHFSRLSSVKTRTKDLKNVIYLGEDVSFHRKNPSNSYTNPYERESMEIQKVMNSKFLTRNRKNVTLNEVDSFNRFNLNKGEKRETGYNDNLNGTIFNKKGDNPVEEELEYNFKEEGDEFYRNDKFESLKKNPRYQDLTHEERQYLQELEARSRLKDPYNKLKGNKSKVDPVRDAKQIMRELSKEEKPEEEPSQIETIGETDETLLMDKRIVEQNKFDEIVSRIRTQIRIEKKKNTEINKLKVPNVKGVVLDPIKKHVLRRAARIGTMLHTHIEQLFTCNKPEFLYKYLNGASISINHVEMPTSKSTVKCYYNILSKHDPKEVQRNLEMVAPKVRFMIARKLELGYTPPVKFIKYNRTDFVNLRRKLEMLETTFNLKLERPENTDTSRLIGESQEEDYEGQIKIRNDQITPELNREIQESFHRRYCGYP